MPSDLPPLFAGLLFAVAWVGHTCIWVALMNFLFGCPIPKPFLKRWRWVTAGLLVLFPLLGYATDARPVLAYLAVCLTFGGLVFPAVTLARWLRKLPPEVAITDTKSFDFWKTLGPECLGDGKLRALTRLPGNDVYKFDLTAMTVTLPDIPAAWDGLTLLLVSDTHFHGTPARRWWDAVFDELAALPTPDVVLLGGDYVDTDVHFGWIGELFGRLRWREGGFAILGNHDALHQPDRVRDALRDARYLVPGNGWQEVTIRGERCVIVGHEGPWFRPPPDLSAAPTGVFRLCLSHTPDNFDWGVRNGIDLMFCGHVHGGGVVLPGVGPIFTPSKYGRRFDLPAYTKRGTRMLLSRGLSGKEPVRFRCPPQAVRVVLRKG